MKIVIRKVDKLDLREFRFLQEARASTEPLLLWGKVNIKKYNTVSVFIYQAKMSPLFYHPPMHHICDRTFACGSNISVFSTRIIAKL